MTTVAPPSALARMHGKESVSFVIMTGNKAQMKCAAESALVLDWFEPAVGILHAEQSAIVAVQLAV